MRSYWDPFRGFPSAPDPRLRSPRPVRPAVPDLPRRPAPPPAEPTVPRSVAPRAWPPHAVEPTPRASSPAEPSRSRWSAEFFPEEAPRPEPPAEGAGSVDSAEQVRAEARLAARELDAAKARLEREQARVLAESRASVVREMLPVLDNLDRSIAAGSRSADPALLEGIKLVRQHFEDALARCGLERVPAEGLPFDPHVHEAIAAAPVDDPSLDGVVLGEVARGYRLEDRLVRPAMVRVGKFAA